MFDAKKSFRVAMLGTSLFLTACASAQHDPLAPLTMSPDAGVRAATQGYLEQKYPDYKTASDSVRADMNTKKEVELRVVGKNPDGSVRLETPMPLFVPPSDKGGSPSEENSIGAPVNLLGGVSVQTPYGGVSPQGANAGVNGTGGGITWNP